MSLRLCVLALLVLSAFATFGRREQFSLFEGFMKKFGKNYNRAEQSYRFKVFQQNLLAMTEAQIKNVKAKFGITMFSDLSDSEFLAKHTGLVVPEQTEVEREISKFESLEEVEADLNQNIDWIAEGKVSPVKNQGQCGSCWAFSATGAIESDNAIKHGNLTNFSEQQMVDCEKKSNGCQGGLMTYAFDYVKKNGQMLESDYPYKAYQSSCKFDSSKVAVRLSGYKTVTNSRFFKANEKKILQALSAQPVSVALDATVLKNYDGGIVTDCSKQLNHGVLITGYTNSAEDGEYYTVKNSWGTGWGVNGYFRIRYGKDTCGISRMTSVPTVA